VGDRAADNHEHDPAHEADIVTPEPESMSMRSRAGRQILRSTAILPSFVTVLNALAGLGAIHYATKEAIGSLTPAALSNLSTAAWLLGLAMLFDMLDGRLARMTRRTSDFGGQLDSLCDAISFGVAPAVLMLRTVTPILAKISDLGHDWHLERIVWSIAGVYLACAVLRLARFNVENEPDESAHMDFRGLPTPGAAAAVAALVLLFERLTRMALAPELLERTWFLAVWGAAITLVTLAGGLLMVSRFKYVHLVNHYVRGRKPFSYLVKLVLLVLALYWQPLVTLALGTNAYALSGPARSAWVQLKGRRKQE